MTKRQSKTRVLSGIRASNDSLHLGNLLGAVVGMKELQDNPMYETFYMVADLHAITTPFKVAELRKNRIDIAIDYLATGIDPNKCTLFLQSDVPEHAEFSYYLSSTITVDLLLHLPAYKEKKRQYKKHPERMTVAVLNYPVLMAADILLYKAEKVPIGRDQLPHLEITRKIARKMNKLYGTNFPEPTQYKTKGEYVPSLLGEGKMSKSVEGSYIQLKDKEKIIREKLAKVPTDSGRGYIKDLTGGVKTLLTLVELFIGKERKKEYEEQYVGNGVRFQDMKEELANAIFKYLAPIQKRREKLEDDPAYVDRVIREGAERARVIAHQTVAEVREKMGLL